MITVKLTIGQLFDLCTEISGVTIINHQSSERSVLLKGLRNQKMSQVLKFWLDDIVEQSEKYSKRLQKLKKELIEKHGEGSKQIDPGHSVYGLITEELEKLNQEEVELKVYGFSIEQFQFEEEESYPSFYRLLRKIKAAKPI